MGLLRGMARTAVVAGTATAVSNKVSRRQAGRWAAKDAEPEPSEPLQEAPIDQDAQIAQLQKLGDLRDKGILTQEEFDAKKAQILDL